MTFRNFLMTAACGMALSAEIQAQLACKTVMAFGTYRASVNGWATVSAPTPSSPAAPLIFAPVVAFSVVTFDRNGVGSSDLPLINVVGGQTFTDILANTSLTVNPDCTVKLTATCTNGCNWQSTAFFEKNTREIHGIITKADGYPLTATIDMKQVSN